MVDSVGRTASGLAPTHQAQARYRSKMKLKGTIRRSDLEGGHWLLEASDGTNYQLVGAVSECKDGMKAEVEGKVDKDAMGIGMTGPHFTVSSIKAV
jgi:hypothetical protein